MIQTNFWLETAGYEYKVGVLGGDIFKRQAKTSKKNG